MKPSIYVVGDVYRADGWPFLSTDEAFASCGNTGNLAFATAVRRLLGPSSDVRFNFRGGHSDDVAVLPCANHLGEHANNKGRRLFCEQFEGHLVAIGLGAQMPLGKQLPALSGDTLGFMRALAAKSRAGAPNIALRGESTRRVFEHHGLGDAVTVLGCPSLLLNPRRDLGASIQARTRVPPRRIAVAAGSPSAHGKYGNVERKLVRLLEDFNGRYIVQHPINTLKMARGESDQVPPGFVRNYRDTIKPAMPVERFTTWFERKAKAFFDIDTWIDHLRSYDLLIGTRIHGCMMAIQAGIPALCLVHDSRTREMCETMKIPFREIGRDDMGFLDKAEFGFMADVDWGEFDRNREQIRARYRAFFAGNGVAENPRYFTDE